MRNNSRRASQRKYHFVYKTTCSITGRYYIGLHSTDNLDDGYLGSGRRLIRSVKKHGIENHTRIILESFSTREAASEREEELVTSDILSDPQCMNCGPGGLGATDRSATSEETRAKISAASKKYVRTKQWCSRISKALVGSSHSDETKQKLRIAHTGKILSEPHKRKIAHTLHGRKRPPEACKNISKGKGRACTVDGVIIYPSKTALVKELGSGKRGSRSPSFRYV